MQGAGPPPPGQGGVQGAGLLPSASSVSSPFAGGDGLAAASSVSSVSSVSSLAVWPAVLGADGYAADALTAGVACQVSVGSV